MASTFINYLWPLVLPLGAVAGETYLSQGLTPAELQERLASDHAPLVVDVRKPIEFGIGHIPGAVNIPVEQLEARLGEVSDADGVLIYCINGSRTRQAEPLLFTNDIDPVYHLEGTFQAWIQGGFPIEKGGVVKKTGW